jgi:hypothetical protein
MSQEALYRVIVGWEQSPNLRRNEVPRPYRQTLPAPLAPAVEIGALSEEPAEDLSPISDSSDTPI